MKSAGIERLLASYETGLIKQEIRTLPARIAEARRLVNAMRATTKDAADALAAAEAEITLAITAEVNGNGKAAYANAEARAAEFVRRRLGDTAWTEAADNLRRADYVMADRQTKLDELIDLFRAYRTVARLIAAELALLADADEDADDVSEDKADVARGANREPF